MPLERRLPRRVEHVADGVEQDDRAVAGQVGGGERAGVPGHRRGETVAAGQVLDLVEHNGTTPELVQMFTVLVGESVAADHPARA
ncbi:hypothetical protein [Dactylosporangium siamense]|uniref:hypothetical protein n=1 Tax=Dactylosporangium siamense TaxID=685454 RepID=UPI001EF1FB32|nr:hypothetical protein [Dactylosporangium siamense]